MGAKQESQAGNRGTNPLRELSVCLGSEQERYGFALINAREPLGVISDLLVAIDSGEVTLIPLDMFEYRVKDPFVRSFSILPTFRLSQMIGDEPGRFDGQFIAEEYSGQQPFLLIPSDQVEKDPS